MSDVNRLRVPVGGILVFVFLATAACDPEKIMNDYYAKMGLNRLAAPRDDIEPGGLILSKNNKALYADNMFDYVTAVDSANQYGITALEKIGDFNAILKKYEGEKSLDAETAIKFLESLLPIKLGGKLNLTGKVNIEMVSAKVRRMKIPTIQTFLNRTKESEPFVEAVTSFLSDGNRTYLVYETWRTKKLKITGEGGKEISSNADIGKIMPLIDESSIKLSYKFKNKSELEITGDKFYVFAVRTGELVKGTSARTLTFKPTSFQKPSEWGIKSAGTDEQYSAPILGNFEGVTFQQ
ncbi:MAG: hypothetical protein L0387_28230 [Acidobacteria bacterium]|nr:hypothetical protein [Acidobacteriota bacterium]MCI0724970.1 hypothetical protein [Acidobacteriota bacterium]